MLAIQWVLRIGVFGTFVGHGVYAIMVKDSWIKYLETIGFDNERAVLFMPIIGVIDILIAIVVLIKPFKPVLLYATFWALAVAIIRPISGEHILEFVERSANWATPLALWLILRHKNGEL